jgi:hypothetical protein
MKIADDVADQLAKSHQQVLDALVDGDRERLAAWWPTTARSWGRRAS